MKDLFCVYLSEEECEQIIAIYEKTGALPGVVRGIRAAQNTKGV